MMRLVTRGPYAGRHWGFAAECLSNLRAQLAQMGQPLVVRIGEAMPMLSAAEELRGQLNLLYREGGVEKARGRGMEVVASADLGGPQRLGAVDRSRRGRRLRARSR